jgi:hypothetical protein
LTRLLIGLVLTLIHLRLTAGLGTGGRVLLVLQCPRRGHHERAGRSQGYKFFPEFH